MLKIAVVLFLIGVGLSVVTVNTCHADFRYESCYGDICDVHTVYSV